MYGMIHCISLTNMRPPKTVVIIISVGDFKIRWYEETLVSNLKAIGIYGSYACLDTNNQVWGQDGIGWLSGWTIAAVLPSCLVLSRVSDSYDSMDHSPPGSSIHRIS